MESKKVKESKTTFGSGGLFGNRSIGSTVLIVVCPLFCLTVWYTMHELKGSLQKLLFDEILEKNIGFIASMWPNPFDLDSMKIIFSYIIFELLLMRFVPGKLFKATITATGHVPEYQANGVQCYLITIATLIILSYSGIVDISIVYDKMGHCISFMSLFAFLFCLFLTFKGLYYPSTKDCGSSGDYINDFFWGTELYPRIFGWDVKQFTNCRFGMMFWQVGIICFAAKQYQVNDYITSAMVVSVLLQTVYIAKFFWWEMGYMCSMDIQHDRAGYYICWGCLVWLPTIYTMHTYHLVSQHEMFLSVPVALLYTVAGIFCIWWNYDCDRQRQEFRRTGGKQKIWGSEPEYIEATYTTADGKKHTSLLLTSGWWGLSRHFHYVPEVLASFFWCIPSFLLHGQILPLFYPLYLSLLLLDRAWRDDKRCAEKYKNDWERYCEKVPYKIIPGVI